MEEAFPLRPPATDALGALATRVLAGETEAFAELVSRTEPRLLGLSWRILGDPDLARDAAQEAYLRAFRSLGAYRPAEPFEPWLVRIAVHACYDLARKRGPVPAAPEHLDRLVSEDNPPPADEAILLHQRRNVVRRALAGLPPGERAALVLRDLEGLSTEEAARILGVRPVTVRSQAATARAKLAAACARLMNSKGGRP
jgi:RNA polymerase sigma-70 factor (ECF subfamily)